MAMALAARTSATSRSGARHAAGAGSLLATAALAFALWVLAPVAPVTPDDVEVSIDVASLPLSRALHPALHEDADTAAPTQAAAQPAAAPSLISAYESAPDLRVFVDAALRRPADGGVFYALRALAECRRWREVATEPEVDVVVQRSHRELAQRRAWADLANRRCAGFIDDELADAGVEHLLALGTGQADPLVLAYRGWLDAVTEGRLESVVAALARVLQRADPALLDWVALTGADYIEANANGRAPLDETARRRRRDAWALLPCELGADCSRPDLGAASRCLAAGRCLEGRRDAVVLHGAWRTDAERAALGAEVDALARTVRSQDAGTALGLAPSIAIGGVDGG
jgi:hypothetical protein